jgi:topoisomerase IA-like protein
VSGVLKGNGLGDEEDLKWINQDAVKIFQGLPNFAQRFAKFVSGKFAPFINKLIEGEGQQQQTPRQKLLKKMAEMEGKEYRPTRTKQEKRLMTDKIARQMMAKLNNEVLA